MSIELWKISPKSNEFQWRENKLGQQQNQENRKIIYCFKEPDVSDLDGAFQNAYRTNQKILLNDVLLIPNFKHQSDEVLMHNGRKTISWVVQLILLWLLSYARLGRRRIVVLTWQIHRKCMHSKRTQLEHRFQITYSWLLLPHHIEFNPFLMISHRVVSCLSSS